MCLTFCRSMYSPDVKCHSRNSRSLARFSCCYCCCFFFYFYCSVTRNGLHLDFILACSLQRILRNCNLTSELSQELLHGDADAGDKGASKWEAPAEMKDFAICKGRQQKSSPGDRVFYACRGSLPDTRGYTCGLWMMLHALSVGCAAAQPGKQSAGSFTALISS
jgi:hypothetical protein